MVELAEGARRASQPCAQPLAQANLPAYKQTDMPSVAAIAQGALHRGSMPWLNQ